ncbi:MAG: DUF434 domain-containing protein [Thermoguttaceae bacterium]
MPDRRLHRGPHPEDARLFGDEALPRLRGAAADFCWLLDRGYAHDSALKLVGDRHQLMARQRTAVSRCCCSAEDAVRRRSREATVEQLADTPLWIDGYNVLTTVEAALAGGVVLVGRDGAWRDMASMHGSYRRVAETGPALELLGQTLAAAPALPCRWLLDRPVSNSGRLKAIIEQVAAAHDWPWQVELTADPDALLIDQPGVIVASADSAILDRVSAWFNLAGETVRRHAPTARVVDLTLSVGLPCDEPSQRYGRWVVGFDREG